MPTCHVSPYKRLITGLLLLPILTGFFVLSARPSARVLADTFDPGHLTSDPVFTALNAMSAADIQTFLVNHGSVLASITSDQLGTGANGRTAAQIIYDATRGSRTDYDSSRYGVNNPLQLQLNPEVILVTLQKEQGLITGAYVAGSPTTAAALNTALGMGCPDNSGCDPAYAGFTNQVIYGAAQLMKNYYQAASSSFVPGQTYSIANTTGPPYNAPATQSVTIGNASTSSLYQYTPHVYNGNYNFWYYMNLWFIDTANLFSSTARVIKGTTTGEVYVATPDLSKKWYLHDMNDLLAWNIPASLETLPNDQLAAIPTQPGMLSRLAKGFSDSDVFYLEKGTRYHVRTDQIFSFYGLHWSDLGQIDDSILSQIPIGPPLGLLSKSTIRSEIYLITGNQKHYIPDEFTLRNWGFTWQDVDQISQWQIDAYSTGNGLGWLVKSENDPRVYVVSDGQRLYIPSLNVLQAWKLDFGMITSVGRETFINLPQGKNLSHVAKGTDSAVYYISDNGTKQYVSDPAKLSAVGASMDDLVQVSNALLARLPAGPNL